MGDIAAHNTAPSPPVTALLAALGRRSVVLVGMMGAGKSSIGRRLAQRLGLGFVDADAEIEAAAGMTIAEIFARDGEPYFRSGEARVIARLLDLAANSIATFRHVRAIPPDQLLRQVCETARDFGEAQRLFEVTPVARPVIYTLAGLRTGERDHVVGDPAHITIENLRRVARRIDRDEDAFEGLGLVAQR